MLTPSSAKGKLATPLVARLCFAPEHNFAQRIYSDPAELLVVAMSDSFPNVIHGDPGGAAQADKSCRPRMPQDSEARRAVVPAQPEKTTGSQAEEDPVHARHII